MSNSVVVRAPHLRLPRAIRRRSERRVWRPWLAASALGVLNGAAREAACADRLGDTAAGQASALTSTKRPHTGAPDALLSLAVSGQHFDVTR